MRKVIGNAVDERCLDGSLGDNHRVDSGVQINTSRVRYLKEHRLIQAEKLRKFQLIQGND